VEKIQVSLKFDKITCTLHKDICTFMIISRLILVRMRKISNTSCRENQNTHLLSINFFFFENRAVYEIMLRNVVYPDRPQTAIRRMRFA
jgi:hypothetical protein